MKISILIESFLLYLFIYFFLAFKIRWLPFAVGQKCLREECISIFLIRLLNSEGNEAWRNPQDPLRIRNKAHLSSV